MRSISSPFRLTPSFLDNKKAEEKAYQGAFASQANFDGGDFGQSNVLYASPPAKSYSYTASSLTSGLTSGSSNT